MSIDYIEIISTNYPGTRCSIIGDPSIYANIIWDGAPILQADLDAWILPMQKDAMWKLIQVERDRRKTNGVKVGTNWFHSDSSSRIQQLGLVMFGASMPAGIMWKTMDNTFVEMTPTLASQIFQASAASDMAIFTVAEQKRAAVMASNDPLTFDYLSGWPLSYGEV